MRHGMALPAFLLIAMPVSAAETPELLTKESARAMPDEALSRRIFGDLGHVMYALPRPERQTREPLRSLDFLTRPRMSYRAGVCETDEIVVSFEIVGVSEEAWARRDPGVRPYGFEKYEKYFIQDFDSARTGDPPGEDGKSELDFACSQIDPREKQLIVAKTAFEVVDGLDSLADLIEAAKKGRALAPLECRDKSGKPIAEADCLAELARLDPLHLYHAALVEGCNRKDPKIYCRSLTVHNPFGYDLSIDVEYARGGSEPLQIRLKPDNDQFLFEVTAATGIERGTQGVITLV